MSDTATKLTTKILELACNMQLLLTPDAQRNWGVAHDGNSQGMKQQKVDSAKLASQTGKDKMAVPPALHSQQKTVWACSLCHQRQQILGKTGKWFRRDQTRATTPTDVSPASSPRVVPSSDTSSSLKALAEDTRSSPKAQDARLTSGPSQTDKRPETLSPKGRADTGRGKTDTSKRSSISETGTTSSKYGVKKEGPATKDVKSEKTETREKREERVSDDRSRQSQKLEEANSRPSPTPPGGEPQTVVSEMSVENYKTSVGSGIGARTEKGSREERQPRHNSVSKHRQSRIVDSSPSAEANQSANVDASDSRTVTNMGQSLGQEVVEPFAAAKLSPPYNTVTAATTRSEVEKHPLDRRRASQYEYGNKRLHTVRTHSLKQDTRQSSTTATAAATVSKSTREAAEVGGTAVRMTGSFADDRRGFEPEVRSTTNRKVSELDHAKSVRGQQNDDNEETMSTTKTASAVATSQPLNSTERYLSPEGYAPSTRHQSSSLRRESKDHGRIHRAESQSSETSDVTVVTDWAKRRQSDQEPCRLRYKSLSKQHSISSSEEDLPSTSECQSVEDFESESYSDRGKRVVRSLSLLPVRK
ncbi:unnamed protein product [Soboliphyme baturini]|uniref:Smoothelin domain-containing protein n=1 Tax=Soboliphyme baturini TaxID=241478 RepID=A0A183IE06_9BILA|nr:unnamed protein product [Soboliphyme baturini]